MESGRNRVSSEILNMMMEMRSDLRNFSRNSTDNDNLKHLISTLIEEWSSAICVFNQDQQLIFFNRPFEILIHPEKSAMPMISRDECFRFILSHGLDPLLYLKAVGNDFEIHPFKLDDGKTLNWKSRSVFSKGEIRYVVWILEDLTVMKKKEWELAQARGKYDYLMESIRILGETRNFDEFTRKLSLMMIDLNVDFYSLDRITQRGSWFNLDFQHPDRDIRKQGKKLLSEGRRALKVQTLLIQSSSENLIREHFEEDPLFKVVQNLKVFSFMRVPMYFRGNLFGVMNLFSNKEEHLFDQESLERMKEMGYLIAVFGNSFVFEKKLPEFPITLKKVREWFWNSMPH